MHCSASAGKHSEACLRHPSHSWLWTSLAAGLAIAGLLMPGVASAQAPAAGDPVVTPPEDVVLETKDGVRIVATYFAGTKAKESVPVILLHDFNGDRQDMFPLAEYLQKTHGFAIMVPDLRGHGQSTTLKNSSNKLSASTMPLNQYPLMVSEDMEKVKSWLVAKNNTAELNIDKLSIVGAGMGATVATLFAARDWEWPILSTGKQGQDVKAVAMISPEFVFKSLNMQAAFGQPGVQKSVSFYIMAGLLDSKATAEANRIYKALTAHRRPEADPKDRTLFLEPSLKTKLQGVKLLTEPELGVSRNIGQFIELRSGSQPFPWANRPNPLG